MSGFLRKRNKANNPAFKNQFPIANVRSGMMVTMNDDGAGSGGEASQQRQALINKLGQRDEDGDPIFVLPGTEKDYPLPHQSVNGDAKAGPRDRVCPLFRFFDTGSRSADFETLGDKFAGMALAREEFMASHSVSAATGSQHEDLLRQQADRQNTEAAGAVKPSRNVAATEPVAESTKPAAEPKPKSKK